MNILKISLFGRFRAEYGSQVLLELEAHKLQELFCYLLLHRTQPHPREALADLLWPENSTAQSKKHLRQLLWQLQAIFEAHLDPGQEPVLLVEPDWIQINPEVKLWLDVAVFEQAFTLTQDVAGQQFDKSTAQALQQAAALYRGDLLEGWYQDWCLYERERLQNIYLAVLEKLMEYCEAHCEYEAGQTYGHYILHYDPARECTHRRLMRLYYLEGNRTAALHQYERCVAALAAELGVKPAAPTTILYEQIRADRLEALGLPGRAVLLPQVPPSTSLLEVLTHLREVQLALHHLQEQVTDDILVIEQLLQLVAPFGEQGQQQKAPQVQKLGRPTVLK